MFVYKSFGLGIHSEIPLPELVHAESPPDVIVRHSTPDDPTPQRPDTDVFSHITPDGVCFCWYEIAGFLIRDGREIIMYPEPDSDAPTLAALVVNDAMGLLLEQRGLVVLHASAVNINGRAVVFVGESGQGKSTTAAALQAAGHEVLADDVIALGVPESEPPYVIPTSPQVKLWPESVTALGYNIDALPEVTPYVEKRMHHLIPSSSQEALPLAALYILDEGPQQIIEPMTPQASLTALMNDFFVNRVHRLYSMLPSGSESDILNTHFRQCVRLAHSGRVRRLKRRFDLAGLSDLARFIEQDAAHQ